MSNTNQTTETNHAPVYTVNIYLAAPGTPINKDGQTTPSMAGHMYYSISNGTEEKGYGFAPIVSGVRGAGRIVENEYKYYQDPAYTRTLEITQEQYNKLKEFGQSGIRKEKKYFDLYYNGVTNSCIDFTWGALNHAGLHANEWVQKPSFDLHSNSQNALARNNSSSMTIPSIPTNVQEASKQGFDGELKVMDNIKDVQSIKAPFPNSIHNKETEKPLPKQNWKHKVVSENTVQDPTQHQASLSTNQKELDIDCMFEALCTAAMNNDDNAARAIGNNYAQSKDGQEFFQQGADFNQKQAEQQEQEQTLLAQQQAENSASKMKI